MLRNSGAYLAFSETGSEFFFHKASVASKYERSEFTTAGGVGGRCKPPNGVQGRSPGNFLELRTVQMPGDHI